MDLKGVSKFFVGIGLTMGVLSVSSTASADEYSWNGCEYGSQECCEPVENCGHWGAWASFIYWKPSEKGVSLGRELVTKVNNTTETSSFAATTKNLDFNFDPGVKVGIGYAAPCCNWDVGLEWTHFYSKANAEAQAVLNSEEEGEIFRNGTAIISDWVATPFITPLASASRWTLNLDLLDLSVGYTFCFQDCFVLRPSIGLRGARINQNYHVGSQSQFYIGGESITGLKSVCDLKGIGPRIGVDMAFKLGYGISLFGSAGGTLLYGKFHTHTDVALQTVDSFSPNFPDPDQEITQPELTYTIAGGVPTWNTTTMSDLLIGLKWDYCFEARQKQYTLGLAVAWEFHTFYDVNQFNFDTLGITSFQSGRIGPDPQTTLIQPLSHRKFGDLTMQGVTVSAAFGF